MKPLTLEETRLKEEMKNNCLKVGKYKDEKAKDKFEMLCHLEDFEVQYWELQQENKQLKDNWNKLKEYIAKEYYIYLPLEATAKSIIILIDKMQEIEGSDSNE